MDKEAKLEVTVIVFLASTGILLALLASAKMIGF
jgi:hypothetical protein